MSLHIVLQNPLILSCFVNIFHGNKWWRKNTLCYQIYFVTDKSLFSIQWLPHLSQLHLSNTVMTKTWPRYDIETVVQVYNPNIP